MPHATLTATCNQIAELLEAADQFVAHDRGQAIVHKWVKGCDPAQMSEQRALAMMADAVLLAADLLLSQPSITGSTAMDRLAKNRRDAPAAAIAGLRNARFRLLRLEGASQAAEIPMRDALTGEIISILQADLPPLPLGTALFSRVAMVAPAAACLAGMVTPLDALAFSTAAAHPSASTGGPRWAEAVFAHVVRYGTLDVPGLNRPTHDSFIEQDEANAEAMAALKLMRDWQALGDGLPSAELLQRSRQHTRPSDVLDTLAAAAMAHAAGEKAMATAIERLLLVQLETIQRREISGSKTLTIDEIARVIDQKHAAGIISGQSARIFADVRRRLPKTVATPGGDPALERLMQIIQALRAKTVEHGCTEQEALAAAEKVAELLDRHGLSLGELDFRAQPCEGIGIQTARRRRAPIDDCVTRIASYFDCRVWLEHAKGTAMRYVFFGLRGDVAAAQYLYEMVERAFETETAAFRASELYAGMTGDRRSAANSFQIGLARGINRKLNGMQTARGEVRRSASGRDLVPVKAAMVDEEMAKLGLDLHSRQARRQRTVISDAFAAGEVAGQRFEPTVGITRAA